ncbi:MAG TPA: hypothetical protein VJT74_05840 [Pyrinomonadaceae bacterium]|nr:hypothetical protein [Pyrinomonadaceae bacterium]
MITGFNTDVEHDGVVYHVQTEDKGLRSPLILSLVYVGGTILASKRTPYEDLISAGYDEKKLAERLNRQHKLICAAIHAGRIEDLKRQTERDAGARTKPAEPARPEPSREAAPPEPAPAPEVEPPPPPSPPPPPPPPAPVAATPPNMVLVSNAEDEPAPVFKPPPPPTFEEVAPPPPQPPPVEHVDYSRVVDYYGTISEVEELQVSLVDEKKFVAGEFVKIHVRVGRGDDDAGSVAGAAVTLKVLGSSFRPLIFTEKTGTDGVATFYTMLPYFTSGRAAILVSATSGSHRAELRRIIHQA